VSLNHGTFEEYRALGMSVTQAKRVITYRGRLDGYTHVDQLEQVPGFPKEFLANLKQQVKP
jgi:DNA uptake protein ComE-like DNA-binding protein